LCTLKADRAHRILFHHKAIGRNRSNLMKSLTLTGMAIAAALSMSVFTAGTASAGADNLKCFGGFNKVQTHEKSIKCKRAKSFSKKSVAQERVKQWADAADCNAHMSPPSVKIWKKDGKWRGRVSFICAIIA
jgi:hypothetical protein